MNNDFIDQNQCKHVYGVDIDYENRPDEYIKPIFTRELCGYDCDFCPNCGADLRKETKDE